MTHDSGMASALRMMAALSGIAVFAAALVAVLPQARDAGALLAARDDPALLSDLQLDATLKRMPAALEQETEAALAAGDVDLAQSFSDLAKARGVALPPGLMTRVEDATVASQSAAHIAGRFATGFATGEADDLASLSGTVAGDLSVYGDVRDLIREGKHLAFGEAADPLLLGLAAVGIVVTAGAYATLGAGAPMRAGLTIFKGARKTGRLSAGLAAWAGRSAREMIDVPQLQRAFATSSLARPGQAAGAVKAAFRAEKAGGLVRVVKDVGRVGEKAGARGALDTIRIAEGPADVARAARLAESKGGQTRAFLKLFGRGALLLAAGAFNLALWIFGAIFFVLGLLSSIKSTTERATYAVLRRGKRKRLERALAEARRTQLATVTVWR